MKIITGSMQLEDRYRDRSPDAQSHTKLPPSYYQHYMLKQICTVLTCNTFELLGQIQWCCRTLDKNFRRRLAPHFFLSVVFRTAVAVYRSIWNQSYVSNKICKHAYRARVLSGKCTNFESYIKGSGKGLPLGMK